MHKRLFKKIEDNVFKVRHLNTRQSTCEQDSKLLLPFIQTKVRLKYVIYLELHVPLIQITSNIDLDHFDICSVLP